jgi:hypothetical protein
MHYSTNNSCLTKNLDLAKNLNLTTLAITNDNNIAGLLRSTYVNADLVNAGLVNTGHIPAPRASLLALS